MDFSVLAQHPLFASLDPATHHALLEDPRLGRRRYRAGQTVHHAHERCTRFEIVISGSVRMEHLSPAGQLLVVARMDAGDDLGGNLLFASDDDYPLRVTATEDTELLSMPAELLLELCARDVRFLTALLRRLTDKTARLTHRIDAIAGRTLRERILADLARWSGGRIDRPFSIPLSKTAWSEHLGCSRTSLSRELKKMRTDRILSFEGRRFVLHRGASFD